MRVTCQPTATDPASATKDFAASLIVSLPLISTSISHASEGVAVIVGRAEDDVKLDAEILPHQPLS